MNHRAITGRNVPKAAVVTKKLTKLRALVRVRAARRKLGLFGAAHVVHFVPIHAHPTGVIPPAAMERPTLCGTYIQAPGDGTTQPDIVTCLQCAAAIESDRMRWAPPRRRVAVRGPHVTYCRTCGGVDGFPPGCRCGPARALRGKVSDCWAKARYGVSSLCRLARNALGSAQ